MSDAEILLLQQEAIRQYGLNPSTSLSYSAGGGNIGAIPDTRLSASPAVTAGSPWPTPSAAVTITVNYQHAVQNRVANPFQNRGSTTYSSMSYPVYFDGTNNIRAMNWQDFNDTILTPAKDLLISDEGTNDVVYRAGTYTIHTSDNLANCTLVDANPIFTDTQADITGFSSGTLPEQQDQPVTVQNYYLHRFNALAGTNPFNFVPPVVMRLSDLNLQSMPTNLFQTLLANDMQYNVDFGIDYGSGTSTKYIQYRFHTTAGNGASSLTSTEDVRGSAMINTYTEVASTLNYLAYGNTYYAQNVPSGTPVAYATWNLVIGYVDNLGNRQ